MKLKQKRLFITRECEFKEHGLLYRVNNLKEGSEITIPYEDILPDKLLRKQETSWIPLMLTPILIIVFFVNLVALLIGDSTEFTYGALIMLFIVIVGLSLSAYLGRRNEILIPAVNRHHFQQFIIIFEALPNKIIVNQFVEELTNRINSYLKEKYGVLDRDFPIESQLQNFLWLKERGAITNTEYEELKNNALGRASTNQSIGFKANPSN